MTVWRKFYGIAGVTGPEFRKVELTSDQRGGILAQASVLTVSSYPDPNLADDSRQVRPEQHSRNASAAASARRSGARRIEGGQRSVAPQADGRASRQCRLRVVPFENGRARLRSRELQRRSASGGPWTASSRSIRPARCPAARRSRRRRRCGPSCSARLPQFAHCVIEKMMIYALGRGLKPYDAPPSARSTRGCGRTIIHFSL